MRRATIRLILSIGEYSFVIGGIVLSVGMLLIWQNVFLFPGIVMGLLGIVLLVLGWVLNPKIAERETSRQRKGEINNNGP